MLWGGRFNDKLDDKAMKFSSSLSFDINLIHEDILASTVHAEMLSKVGLISEDEFNEIKNGLKLIEEEWTAGKWIPDENEFEDVHSAIESRLKELIGVTAGKLHTGRSRNDQVATDMKLWIRKASSNIIEHLTSTQKVFLELAEAHSETIIPGYTHLQRAQPISFAFHLLAYVEMFSRDKQRFTPSVVEGPLGAGALAGSTLPLDREFTSAKLGFDNPTRNALDTVSDRDYLLDFLNACSIGMMHLSRLAEEIILWSSSEWKLIKLADKYTTGSSLMPQKKNPDMAELVRGKTGRVFGNQFSLLTTLKGLPLSYNRDLQEDKEQVFDSFFTYADSLSIIKGMMETAQVNSLRFIEELKNDFSLATDLADWLVLKGIPFRDAHEIVGKVVKFAEDNNKTFGSITLEEMKKINHIFDETALECFNIETSLQRKETFGSPNPTLVKGQIEYWKKKLA